MDVRVREPKGREGLPRVLSQMSPVVTTRFSSCWVGVGVCLSAAGGAGRPAQRPVRRSAAGCSAGLPACTEEVVA